MKIVIINHTFQEERFYKRWKLLAQAHPDLDVTLLAPESYEWGKNASLSYGKSYVQEGNAVEDGNFHIHLIDMQRHRYRGWTSKKLEHELKAIQPDFVYHIGEHTQESLIQVIRLRNRYIPKMKVLAFSMRGHQHALKLDVAGKNLIGRMKALILYLRKKRKIALVNRYCDAIFCHYPDGMDEFVREGFEKPIYMQTQVGVDKDVFYPDAQSRKAVREKYRIDDSTYVFGSASRFHFSKGLSVILDALPAEGNWKYIMMGWGSDAEVAVLKEKIQELGLEDKVILTGYINNWKDMAEHWNALDCAVHVPLTTPQWEETFSLALVQAMATALPVIGSSSGSVPYQIGPDGVIVPENDSVALNEKMRYFMENPQAGRCVGEKMLSRAVNSFEIRHLNELFYVTLKDIAEGIYDKEKVDMATYLEN